MPVSGLDSQLFLSLSLRHTLLDTVVDARCVAQNDGRSVICLSLCECLDALIEVSAHRNLCDVDIAVAHHHGSQILLLGLLAGCRKLSDCTGRGSLGGLSACVGVHLSIKDTDIDILAGCQYMVNAAESDIIGPAIAAEDPVGLLCQIILVLQEPLRWSFHPDRYQAMPDPRL